MEKTELMKLELLDKLTGKFLTSSSVWLFVFKPVRVGFPLTAEGSNWYTTNMLSYSFKNSIYFCYNLWY